MYKQKNCLRSSPHDPVAVPSKRALHVTKSLCTQPNRSILLIPLLFYSLHWSEYLVHPVHVSTKNKTDRRLSERCRCLTILFYSEDPNARVGMDK